MLRVITEGRVLHHNHNYCHHQVYCVIGCCEQSDEHYEVARTADDYLWLKLSFIKTRPNNEPETFSYSDLQKLILEEYGTTFLLKLFGTIHMIN